MKPNSSLQPRWSPPLCFSTLGCAELNFAQTIALAREFQIGAIEVRCLSGQTIEPSNFSTHFPPPSSAWPEVDTSKVELTGLGTSVKLMNPRPTDLDDLIHFARLADNLQCPWLRVFDGGNIGHPLSSDDLTAAQDLVNAWESARQKLNLNAQLMVETHDGLTSIEAITRFREVLPEVAILWDTHHTWRAGESLSGYHQTAKSAIVHIHVKDSIDVPSSRKPFTYCLPGEGQFPWSELGQLLRTQAFLGKISLEWERHWHPDLDPIQLALPLYRNILAQW